MIAVSLDNYLALKRLGSAGDSFNDVISEILKKQKLSQTPRKASHPIIASAIADPKPPILEGSDSGHDK